MQSYDLQIDVLFNDSKKDIKDPGTQACTKWIIDHLDHEYFTQSKRTRFLQRGRLLQQYRNEHRKVDFFSMSMDDFTKMIDKPLSIEEAADKSAAFFANCVRQYNEIHNPNSRRNKRRSLFIDHVSSASKPKGGNSNNNKRSKSVGSAQKQSRLTTVATKKHPISSAQKQSLLTTVATKKHPKKPPTPGLELEKLKKQEHQLSVWEETQISGEWASTMFHKYKMLTKKMLDSDTIGGAMVKEAFTLMQIRTSEEQEKKRAAVKAIIKAKFNRCKDYFVDCIKQTVIEDRGVIIKNHEYLMRDLWTMHELRSTHRIGMVAVAIQKLWEWYCLELLRRCARKNWEWGQERNRKEEHFCKCVWPGDEAFVMANLEAKIEHYCQIRDAKSSNSYEKKRQGRVRGQRRNEKASPSALANRYNEFRHKIVMIRHKAGLTPAILDEEVTEVNNIMYTWDEYIRNLVSKSSGVDQKEARSTTDFNDMIFEEDGL